ncbi:hypothetical protein Tco_0270567 [Tanacetum coccineum]
MKGEPSISYACSDSLLLTPLCCDDIHDVTPRVSALAGCDRLVSEPLVIENIYQIYNLLCAILESCLLQLVASRSKFHWGIAFATGRKRFTDPETKLRMKHTNRRVRIPKVPLIWRGRTTEQPRALNKYGFVDHPELQMNEFASHRLPQREGNMNGWLIKDEDEPLEPEASEKG